MAVHLVRKKKRIISQPVRNLGAFTAKSKLSKTLQEIAKRRKKK